MAVARTSASENRRALSSLHKLGLYVNGSSTPMMLASDGLGTTLIWLRGCPQMNIPCK